jgi:hypothetical protein
MSGLFRDVEQARWAEKWLVWLIAAHTFVIGLALLLAPTFALSFGGWKEIPAPFFPQQAGVFHFVLGFGYLRELQCRGGVSLLLLAKTAAFVFLMGSTVLSTVPWFVTFAGVADGLMGLTAWWVHRQAARG